MFTQFIMECNLLLHRKVEKHFLIEDIDILLVERERMVKNFEDVPIDGAQVRIQPR